MTSKIGALLKNQKTRRAVYEVLQDIFEAHHIKCFEAFRSHFTAKGNIDEMEKEYQAFLRTVREIFNRVGGEFSYEIVEQAIPGNKWLAFHDAQISSVMPEFIKNRRFLRSERDNKELYQNSIRKNKDLTAYK